MQRVRLAFHMEPLRHPTTPILSQMWPIIRRAILNHNIGPNQSTNLWSSMRSRTLVIDTKWINSLRHLQNRSHFWKHMTRNRQARNFIRVFLGKKLRDLLMIYLTCLPAWVAKSSRPRLLLDSQAHRNRITSILWGSKTPSTLNSCTIIKWDRVRSKCKVTNNMRRRWLNPIFSITRPSANMARSKVNITRNSKSTKKTSVKLKIKCQTFLGQNRTYCCLWIARAMVANNS